MAQRKASISVSLFVGSIGIFLAPNHRIFPLLSRRTHPTPQALRLLFQDPSTLHFTQPSGGGVHCRLAVVCWALPWSFSFLLSILVLHSFLSSLALSIVYRNISWRYHLYFPIKLPICFPIFSIFFYHTVFPRPQEWFFFFW